MTTTDTQVPVKTYYLALADQIISGLPAEDLRKVISYNEGKRYSDLLRAQREITEQNSNIIDSIVGFAKRLEDIVNIDTDSFDTILGKPTQTQYNIKS